MKRFEKKIMGAWCFRTLAFLALAVTTLNVNAVCMLIAHQPKLPDNAIKLRKF